VSLPLAEAISLLTMVEGCAGSNANVNISENTKFISNLVSCSDHSHGIYAEPVSNVAILSFIVCDHVGIEYTR